MIVIDDSLWLYWLVLSSPFLKFTKSISTADEQFNFSFFYIDGFPLDLKIIHPSFWFVHLDSDSFIFEGVNLVVSSMIRIDMKISFSTKLTLGKNIDRSSTQDSPRRLHFNALSLVKIGNGDLGYALWRGQDDS